MKTTTSNYDTENAKAQKAPVIVVEFSGVTRKYASGTYGDISANHKKYIMPNVKITSQTLHPLYEPFAIVGESSFEILDKDLDVTTQIADNDMEGRDVTIKAGYQALNDADFVSLPKTNTKSIQLSSNMQSWQFITKDARKLVNQDLFRAIHTTNLSSAIDNSISTTTIAVDTTAGFLDPTNLPPYYARSTTISGFILVSGREVIRYEQLNGTVDFNSGGRGFANTAVIAHEDNAEVIQFWYPSVNIGPHEWLLNLLMTTDDASGHAYYDLAKFDTSFKRMGLGLTTSEVNILDIERMGNWWFGGVVHLEGAWGFKSENAIDYITENILKPCGWYLYLDNDGKLTVGSIDRTWIDTMFSIGNLWQSDTPTSTQGVAVPALTLGNDDIISADLTIASDELINQIEVHEQFRPTSSEADIIGTFKLDESVTDYGATKKPFVIKTTANLANQISENDTTYGYLKNWFYFFGNPPGYFTLRLLMKRWILEAGDFLKVTYNKLPELKDKTRGWTTKKALVLGQRTDWFSSPPVVELDCVTWELFNKVDLETSIVTIAESAIDDKALTFSSDNTATVEGADALVNLDGSDGKETSPTTQVCVATIEITPSGAGSGEQWIEIGLHAQNPSGTNVGSPVGNRNFNYIHFDASSSTKFDVLLQFISRATFTLSTFKVDWFDASAGAGNDRPSAIKFKTLRYFTLQKDMTTV